MAAHLKNHTLAGGDHPGNGTWKLVYSDGSGDVQELALGASGAALLGGGAAAAPAFSSLLQGSSIVSAAGETPADTDISSWANDTWGFIIGTTGRIFIALKNATDCYYVELTAL